MPRCPSCHTACATTLATCPTCGRRLAATVPATADPTPRASGARSPSEDTGEKEIGNYKLLKILGQGGLGKVYLAEHTKLGRTVAIKVLHRSLALDRSIVSRFFHEARVVNTIRHRNVVDIYDFVAG